MVKQILLTQGEIALIDDEDYALVNQYKWRLKPGRRVGVPEVLYAQRTITINGKDHSQFLHKLILPVDGDVDHVDGNGLNNCRLNLRLATRSQNCAAKRSAPGISGLRGVSWNKQRTKWRAMITCNYKKITIGQFESKEEAAIAYDQSAIELFGEFAVLNFPTQDETVRHTDQAAIRTLTTANGPG